MKEEIIKGEKKMKKLIAAILCVVMVVSIFPMSVFAASGTLVREEALAKELKALGIFKGVSETDFALDRAPTRVEALVMLIRVLGREKDALAKGGKHPFLDVPQWADKYVGYAYSNNLTNGVSATKFGSMSTASASMYMTFVLRALGYSDSNGDFTWDNPFALARQTGIMNGNPDIMNFLRADVVLVSYAALEAEIKGTKTTLAQKLIEAKVFTAEAYDKYYNVSEFANEGKSSELTPEEIYAKCSPAVFYIEVYDAKGKALGTGSGFFIKADGTAVTNYHVIDGAAKIKIRRSDNGKIYTVKRLYDYDEKEDWAVIKIDGENFPYLEIEKEAVRGGQTVYAIGSPLGLENTISEGLISNTNRPLDGVSYIQISVPISPGSSGGALINKAGKVIGITSAGFTEGQNVNLALPISIIEGYWTPIDPHDRSGEYENTNLTVGDVDVSDMWRGDAAAHLLQLWIANYSNMSLEGNDAYREVFEDDNGTETLIVSFDSEANRFYIISQYEFEVGARIATYMAFSPNDEDKDVQIVYEYYYEGSSLADITGEQTLKKLDFSSDLEIKFKYNAFLDDAELHEKNAAALLLDGLWFVDNIMKGDLVGYGITGIADLGFKYF